MIFVYDVVPDLIYTRDREVFRFLESIILSDKKECTSAYPDREMPFCADTGFFEYIANAIQDFPIPSDNDGEAQITDYEKALEEVRLWFAGNPHISFEQIAIRHISLSTHARSACQEPTR